MDTELLVGHRAEAGQRLLIELARAGVEISAAAWLKHSDDGRWRLYIGSKSVGAGKSGDAFVTLYNCLKRLPGEPLDILAVKLIPDTSPAAQFAAAARTRYPGTPVARTIGEERVGEIGIDAAYIYPAVSSALTRDEVLLKVTNLLQRTGLVANSTVVLRDGTIVVGVPYGVEANRVMGRFGTVDIKLFDDEDGTTHSISADEVVSIQ